MNKSRYGLRVVGFGKNSNSFGPFGVNLHIARRDKMSQVTNLPKSKTNLVLVTVSCIYRKWNNTSHRF